MIGAKPLSIRFDKMVGFIRVYDGTRCLVLFGAEKYDFMIKVDSYDSLSLEQRLTFHTFMIHIKSVGNKDQNYYYYNTFLQKCSY